MVSAIFLKRFSQKEFLKVKIIHSLAKEFGKLKYDELLIDPNIFLVGFPARCNLKKCRSMCCSVNCWIDLKEVENILKYSEKIVSLMDKEKQSYTPDFWFISEKEDPDTFSGKVKLARMMNDRCIFLRKDYLCTLQLCSITCNLHKWYLKPFYSIMYPLVLIDGVLQPETMYNGKLYCEKKSNWKQSLFEACRQELIFILGEENYELLAKKKSYYEKINKMNFGEKKKEC